MASLRVRCRCRSVAKSGAEWRRWIRRGTSFAAYIVRAVLVTVGLFGFSIALSAAAYYGYLPRVYTSVAALVAIVLVFAEVFVLQRYSEKIMSIETPIDPQVVGAVSVGAVSSVATFMGTAAALAATILVATSPPVGSPAFGAFVGFILPALWIFIVLTARFREACCFYHLWETKRMQSVGGG